jgi:hypothetical protein
MLISLERSSSRYRAGTFAFASRKSWQSQSGARKRSSRKNRPVRLKQPSKHRRRWNWFFGAGSFGRSAVLRTSFFAPSTGLVY